MAERVRKVKRVIMSNGADAKISQWYLQSLYNENRYKLRYGKSTVGRAPTVTIKINVSGLSKEHADFHVIKDSIWVVDRSKLGVYVNKKRIEKNEFIKLEKDSIITFGLDLDNKDNTEKIFKFLSFRLKFKSEFIDLTSSDEENDNNDDNDSLKVLIKTTKNGITIEKLPKHRTNKHSSSRSSAEPTTSNSSSDDGDDKKEKESKKKEKNAEKKSKKEKPSHNGPDDEDDKKEKNPKKKYKIREPPMVAIPLNSNYNKPKCAIVIDALPLKRQASERIQFPSKIRAVESTSIKSPVRIDQISPLQSPIQSPRDVIQNESQKLPLTNELIKTMIKWSYTHMKAGYKYTTQLTTIPPHSFDSLETFKNTYATLIQSTLYQFAKEVFSIVKSDIELIFRRNKSESQNGIIRRELIFITNGNVRPRANELFLIENLNGEKKVTFMAYVMSAANDTIDLLMLSRHDMTDVSKIKVISRCDCESLINYYETIESMVNIGSPSVLNGLLHPSTLSLLKPRDQCFTNCIFGKSNKCLKPFTPKQYEVFWNGYNNALCTLKASMNKVLVTLVDGFPGSGKSDLLIEIVIALSRTTEIQQPKILITAGTDEEIDVLAMELHKIRMSHPDLASRLTFIRYGEISPRYRDNTALVQYSPSTAIKDFSLYKEHVANTKIIFCHPRFMYKLQTKYVRKVDVCLLSNASRILEYESIIPTIFTPKVFLLFGNNKVKPSDNLNMEQLFPGMNVQQSLYQRLYNFKKERNQTILTLETNYRFDFGIHDFLNTLFYDNEMIYNATNNNDCNNNNRYPLTDFRMIHFKDESLLAILLQKMIKVANPREFKYAIIMPPDCSGKFGSIPIQMTVSTNMTFNLKDCDIMIIWPNPGMINTERFSPDGLHYAMTKVKRSLFIVGDISELAKDKNWNPVYNFANKRNKVLTTSAVDLDRDFATKLLNQKRPNAIS